MTPDKPAKDSAIRITENRELVTLWGDSARQVSRLDAFLSNYAERELRADAVRATPLYAVTDLNSIDYFTNFPHLCSVVSPLAFGRLDGGGGGMISDTHVAGVPSAEYCLPSAACYGVYFALRGLEIENPVMATLVSNCFRREDQYEGLSRLYGFNMREFVYIGGRDEAREHVELHKNWISTLLNELGLEFVIDVAQDPFYDGEASRSVLQRLDPVKWEFRVPAFDQSRSVAIASVNLHKNFFGDRCSMTYLGESAFSSCVAFGLERWLWAFDEYGLTLEDVNSRLERYGV